MSTSSPAIQFGSKSNSYRENATMQFTIAEELVKKIDCIDTNSDQIWVDIGSGPAIISDLLQKKESCPTLINFDISELTLSQLNEKHNVSVCGSMDNFSFLPNSLNGIVSSSAFQWSENISELFKMLSTSIKPNGIVAFSVFTNGSLKELKATQEAFNLPQSVKFPTDSLIHELLIENGFIITHQNDTQYSEQFNSGLDSLRAISQIGASYHKGKLLSPQKLRQFVSYLENQFSGNVENRYSVSTFIARMES